MSGADFVRVTEVGPRDGLQNERATVPVWPTRWPS